MIELYTPRHSVVKIIHRQFFSLQKPVDGSNLIGEYILKEPNKDYSNINSRVFRRASSTSGKRNADLGASPDRNSSILPCDKDNTKLSSSLQGISRSDSYNCSRRQTE